MRTAVIVLAIALPASAWAAPLKVGEKASDFRLKDAFGKVYRLSHFKSPVLAVWYEGAKSRYQNSAAKNMGRKLRDAGRLDPRFYRGIGIANLQEHWASNWIMRQAIKRVVRRDRTLVLCDEDKTMQRQWGFRNGRSNVYIFDHNRVLRWKSSGPLSKRRVRQLWRFVLRLIKQYKTRSVRPAAPR